MEAQPQGVELYEVNIATNNLCNRRCAYCKFGQERPWERATMPEELFEKILSDLAAVDFSGILSPFANNEPLLDKRMCRLVGRAHTVLPKARLFLFSNGDLLDRRAMELLFEAGLSKLFLSLHDPGRLAEHEESARALGDQVQIVKFYELGRASFHNFAGTVHSSAVTDEPSLDRGCCLPFRQLVINAQGTVDLCCADIYSERVFGDARNRSVVDIFFNDPELNLLRAGLAKGDRRGLNPCERCSFGGTAARLVV